MEHITDEDMRKALEEYLKLKDTSQRLPVYKHLQARPSFANPDPILPLDELEIKLEIIERIRMNQEEGLAPGASFRFSNIQLASLLLAPVDVLRYLEQNAVSLDSHLIPQEYLRFFVHGRVPRGSQSGSQSASQAPNSARGISRNAAQRDKCLLRDQQACILTKAAYPEVCHIVPYAISSTQANLDYLIVLRPYTAALLGNQAINFRQTATSVGSLDKVWNMICLHPTLHSWWSKCLFGLKCLGIMPKDETTSAVQIQFHWMPRNGLSPKSFVDPPYNQVALDMLQTIDSAQGGGRCTGIIADINRDSFHPLETGQTFEIPVENKDAIDMKTVLDLQWAVVRLSALSGAAGELEFDFDAEGPSGNVPATERVEDWIRNLSEPASP